MITTYNVGNPPIQEIIKTFLSYLGRSSAIKDLSQRNVIVAHRRPPSLRGKLVRTKIATPINKILNQCKRPQTYQYCTGISESGKILNLNNQREYNTIRLVNFKINNLIYFLEYNTSEMKYVGQTRNRIIERFQGHLFDIKHNANTTVAIYFASHQVTSNPEFTIYVLEYIKIPKFVSRSNTIRNTG